MMRFLVWLVRAFIFFTLFAFALNNQHEVKVHWFFGLEWRTSMVQVVLWAFGGGAVLGVLAMLPLWWRARRATSTASTLPNTANAGNTAGPATQPPLSADRVPREAL